jgi:hypothetical protein
MYVGSGHMWAAPWPYSVVVISPLLDDDLSFFQAVEDLSIEQLVA